MNNDSGIYKKGTIQEVSEEKENNDTNLNIQPKTITWKDSNNFSSANKK